MPGVMCSLTLSMKKPPKARCTQRSCWPASSSTGGDGIGLKGGDWQRSRGDSRPRLSGGAKLRTCAYHNSRRGGLADGKADIRAKSSEPRYLVEDVPVVSSRILCSVR